MIVSILAAVDEGGGIGVGGRLPWHLPADLKRFKALTMGHHLIMGRKTFASIGRPLVGRTIIVLSRNPEFRPQGCLVARSLEQALSTAQARGEQEVFVVGGSEVFRRALPLAARLYLTRVHARAPADARFPEVDWSEWVEVESRFHPADERNEFAFTLRRFERAPRAVPLDKSAVWHIIHPNRSPKDREEGE